MDQAVFTKVLGMDNTDHFAVVAIDVDVWGYGLTVDEAMNDLESHLRTRILALKHMCKNELLNRPAPEEFHDMYKECLVSYMKDKAVPGWWIGQIPLLLFPQFSRLHLVSNNNFFPSPALRHAAGECRRSTG